jgi:hypothetical protein
LLIHATTAVDTGTRLQSRDARGKQTAQLRASSRDGNFIIADIISGWPQVGNIVVK